MAVTTVDDWKQRLYIIHSLCGEYQIDSDLFPYFVVDFYNNLLKCLKCGDNFNPTNAWFIQQIPIEIFVHLPQKSKNKPKAL